MPIFVCVIHLEFSLLYCTQSPVFILNTSITMIKIFRSGLLLSLAFVTTHSFALQCTDTTKPAKLRAAATFSLNSNGIATVPAFSLGKPAAIASVSVGKGWFSYDPTLGYSLDGHPWFIDNWLHVKLVNRPGFELRTGMNVSTFCGRYTSPEGDFYRVERYFTFELAGIFRFSDNMSLLAQYWNDRGQEDWSLKGHFVSATFEKADMKVGKHILFTAALQLFYIDYNSNDNSNDNNDGLFVAPRVAFSVRNFPVSIFSQAVQAISSNIEPFPGFNINVGIAYTL
jgi:hypothetical protein